MSCPRTKSVEAGSQDSAVSSNMISEARRIESGPGLRVSPRIFLPVSCRRACVSLTILVQISSSTKHHSKQYWCGPRCWCDGRGAMFLRRTMWLTTLSCYTVANQWSGSAFVEGLESFLEPNFPRQRGRKAETGAHPRT